MTQAFVNLGVTQAMSPHINSLVGDLVAMAQAMERVPQLEQELSQIKLQLDNAQFHNQNIELSIIDYKQQIEGLQSKVRSLEVERDDASFRVLEAEDRDHTALAMARSVAAAVGNIIFALDPPKPEPEVVQATETPHPDTSPPDWKQDQAETSRMPQDQSVSDPTQQANQNVAGTTTTNTAQTRESTEEAPKPDVEGAKPLGPYFNKRYYDQSEAIPLDQWLAGDGTETDYHWRPSNPSYGSTY